MHTILSPWESGEFPAARVRHSSYNYSATMTWSADLKATARGYAGDLTIRENVVAAAWSARRNLASKIFPAADDAADRAEFADITRYATLVSAMGTNEYVVTFVPRYLIEGA